MAMRLESELGMDEKRDRTGTMRVDEQLCVGSGVGQYRAAQ